MNKTFCNRFLSSYSDNRKSKIENLKWVGIFAIALTFVFGGVAAITAKQIGLTIPPNVLVRADRVIR